MGFDFFDFFDWTKIACLPQKILTKAEKIVKNAWSFARACVSLYQNSEGDRARPEIARKGTKRLERHDKSIDH